MVGLIVCSDSYKVSLVHIRESVPLGRLATITRLSELTLVPVPGYSHHTPSSMVPSRTKSLGYDHYTRNQAADSEAAQPRRKPFTIDRRNSDQN